MRISIRGSVLRAVLKLAKVWLSEVEWVISRFRDDPAWIRS
jgi:hypothetical protein